MTKPFARHASDPQVRLGLITVMAVVGTVLVVLSQVVPTLLAPGGQTVEAEFETTGQLEEGNPVRIDGVDVGEVEEIEVNRGGRSATVRMTIREQGQPLYRNATAAVRWRLVLGGTLVVDIDPGTPTAGELDAEPIPISRTSEQVELDEITTALGGDAERGMQQMLHELPRALANASAPEAALGTLADLAPTIGGAADALRGQRDGDLTALVRSTARTVRALDAPTEPVRALVEGAATTLETTAQRHADLRRMLELAPPAMDQTMSTLARLDTTLALANPLFERLERPAAELAPTADALRPTLVGADRLLREAEPLLRSLRPALSDLALTSRQGVPLLREIGPTLQRLDERLLPALAEVDPVSRRPTFQMIGPLFAAATGAAGGFDADATYWNFSFGQHPDVLATRPCQVLFSEPDEIATCESMLEILLGSPSDGRRR